MIKWHSNECNDAKDHVTYYCKPVIYKLVTFLEHPVHTDTDTSSYPQTYKQVIKQPNVTGRKGQATLEINQQPRVNATG